MTSRCVGISVLSDFTVAGTLRYDVQYSHRLQEVAAVWHRAVLNQVAVGEAPIANPQSTQRHLHLSGSLVR
jgi:hypothetical protein